MTPPDTTPPDTTLAGTTPPGTTPGEAFERQSREEVERLGASDALRALTRSWFLEANRMKYSYHFHALGRPVIQYPQDMVAIQELIWAVRPTLVVETGIAHGGSLVLSAAMLALLDYADAVQAGRPLDPLAPGRRVVGVDIDIRGHNRAAIEAHPMAHKIHMVQGSSVDAAVVAQVRGHVREDDRVLVLLDSNHTHAHVLAELQAYAPLTSPGSYCVVFDTVIDDMPQGSFPDRPWDVGDNPRTAVRDYLARLAAEPGPAADGQALRFEVDHAIEHRLLVTVAPGGYLRRVPAA